MKKYHGKITYTIDKDHPDIKYVADYTEEKIFTFEDTYSFDESRNLEWQEESNIKAYIKRDLKLVAGGGYNTDHIHNVKFEINRV